MSTGVGESDDTERVAWPSISIVFLVYNRRDELRVSLQQMLSGCDYDPERVDLIVVDNASTDGSGAMVAEEFPQVRLVVRDENVGVSGWNDGFAVAQGDYVLALDDDCYLEGADLRRAVQAAEDREADLVSFAVSSSDDPDYRFNEKYRTGLLSFWGCAVLMRRSVVEALHGYDPEIFVWANELEFMLRFFDHGFRHLHMPELVAVHMKAPGKGHVAYINSRAYRINGRHFAYIAGKLFRRRDAFEAFLARAAIHIREAIRVHPSALRALPHCVAGFLHGLRYRHPVSNPEVSRAYRRNFETFASPWWVSRPLREFLLANRSRDPRRRFDEYFTDRARYYPKAANTLEF